MRKSGWLVPTLGLLLAANAHAAKTQKLEGYAEWRKGDALIIDGRHVIPGPECRFKGKAGLYGFDQIPLGYEVKVKAEPLPDGTWLAHTIEAKPNNEAMFEGNLRYRFNALEREYVHRGHVFDRRRRDVIDYGRLLMDGPDVDRGPELFIGRIQASNLPLYHESEVALLHSYFQRNHAYRIGTPSGHSANALYVAQDDFQTSTGCGCREPFEVLTRAYRDTAVVAYQHDNGYAVSGGTSQLWWASAPAQRTTLDTREAVHTRLSEGFGFATVFTHANSTVLGSFLTSDDLAENASLRAGLPLFANVHGCYTARLQDNNNLASMFVMGGSLGYIGVGAMGFYPPQWDVALVEAFRSHPIGPALRHMHQTAYDADPWGTSVQWQSLLHLLLGDPTLRRR